MPYHAQNLHPRPQYGGRTCIRKRPPCDGNRLRHPSSLLPTPSPMRASTRISTCTIWGQLAAREIEKAGAIAKQSNTIAIDDGIAMGHSGMLYSCPAAIWLPTPSNIWSMPTAPTRWCAFPTATKSPRACWLPRCAWTSRPSSFPAVRWKQVKLSAWQTSNPNAVWTWLTRWLNRRTTMSATDTVEEVPNKRKRLPDLQLVFRVCLRQTRRTDWPRRISVCPYPTTVRIWRPTSAAKNCSSKPNRMIIVEITKR